MIRQQLFDTSRGRIVTLLQQGGLTVDEIAVKLGLTANAIRAQLKGWSETVSSDPAVCLALESLITEIVGAPVHECCDRAGRPRCCFEVES